MNLFDLCGIFRKLNAIVIVWFFMFKGKKILSKQIKFYLCPDNLLFMVKLDGSVIHTRFNVDIKLLLEILTVITSKKHQNTLGFNLQKSIYTSSDNRMSGTFDVITLSLSNEAV